MILAESSIETMGEQSIENHTNLKSEDSLMEPSYPFDCDGGADI